MHKVGNLRKSFLIAILSFVSLILAGCDPQEEEIEKEEERLYINYFYPIKVEFIGIEPSNSGKFISECKILSSGGSFSIKLSEDEMTEDFCLWYPHLCSSGWETQQAFKLPYKTFTDKIIKEYWGEIKFTYNPFIVHFFIYKNETGKTRSIKFSVGEIFVYRDILIKQEAEVAN